MLLLIRFPVTDKPTRRAVGPARNRVASGHMRRRRLAALFPARASCFFSSSVRLTSAFLFILWRLFATFCNDMVTADRVSFVDFLPWQRRKTGTPVFILTGAGISVDAGLPAGPALATAVLRRLASRIPGATIDVETIASAVPLETVFQSLADYAGPESAQRIVTMMDTECATRLHWAIRDAGEAGCLNGLYTFNFDTLHERAFPTHQLASTDGRTVLKTMQTVSGRPITLAKLHGSAEVAGILTLAEYVSGFSDGIRNRFRDDVRGTFWLVLGYGGWDLDFHQMLRAVLRDGACPAELIWVDVSFPKRGGRTALVELLKEHGCIVHAVVSDIQNLRGLTGMRRAGGQHPKGLDEITEPLESVSAERGAAVVAQLALCQPTSQTAAAAIEAGRNAFGDREPWDFLKARYLDVTDHVQEAVALYRTTATTSSQVERRMLSAVRAFALSKGETDLFDRVDTTGVPATMAEVFRLIASARRTDLGGLDRTEAFNWCKALPAARVLSRELTSTDWVRFLVSALSEIARLYHEAGAFDAALDVDLYALAVAEPLADPTQTVMVAGNVGACYMGMADNAGGKKEAERLLMKAAEFLTQALGTGASGLTFAVGLHTANLGVVRGEQGRTRESIHLLRRGLGVIEGKYPNYAVCFWGDLGRILASAAKCRPLGRREVFIRAAAVALMRGANLAQRLSDYDDRHFLTRGLHALKEATGAAGDIYAQVMTALAEQGISRDDSV